MRSSDLVPFLAPDNGLSLKFRQGKVLSWDSGTGANVVDVGGAILTDVPILNTGEAIALREGHIVGLLAMAGSFFILGRITVPGDPDFAGASVSFGGASVTTTNWAPTMAGTWVIDSEPIPIPSWADEAIVMVSASVRVVNTRGVTDIALMHPFITTTFGGGIHPDEVAVTLAAGGNGNLSNSAQKLFTELDPGSDPDITASVIVQAGGTANWAANVSNTAILSAIAIFRSTT
ncbi:hypothetical protein [Kribbella italica]|uniref:Uncharacterized protein n=1 Tax=Kribbella italica TaxID=1540520 RepID=A0A7W9J9F5_9ACTN|nr:hypothetical protein [Kribbella italica]MBB5837744.1 hypothetical protein [Kribbella italica]